MRHNMINHFNVDIYDLVVYFSVVHVLLPGFELAYY